MQASAARCHAAALPPPPRNQAIPVQREATTPVPCSIRPLEGGPGSRSFGSIHTHIYISESYTRPDGKKQEGGELVLGTPPPHGPPGSGVGCCFPYAVLTRPVAALVLYTHAVLTRQVAALMLWLDRATIRFRFIGPNSGCTGSFCVFGPVLSSPAHGPISLAMGQI
jgi:hypothetical protein